VLAYECLGAIVMVAFCWLREMKGMANWLFRAQQRPGD